MKNKETVSSLRHGIVARIKTRRNQQNSVGKTTRFHLLCGSCAPSRPRSPVRLLWHSRLPHACCSIAARCSGVRLLLGHALLLPVRLARCSDARWCCSGAGRCCRLAEIAEAAMKVNLLQSSPILHTSDSSIGEWKALAMENAMVWHA